MNPSDDPIPMLDLAAEFDGLRERWFAALDQCGRQGQWVLGEQVAGFETEAAAYLGCGHAVAVASGTDALVLALRALDIGPGDEVLTSPYTFFATVEAISLVGATPVFADTDPASFNLDPESAARRITSRTRAILVVHLFGCPADMDTLRNLADARGLRLIEDAAQAFGAEYHGARVGSLGDAGCFSFYPTKVLGGYGDGGLVCVPDAAVAERLRRLRNHGAIAPFIHDQPGTNSRLDEVQAALLRIKLESIEDRIAERRGIARMYLDRFGGLGIGLPQDPSDGRHVFNLFTLRSGHRDAIRDALTGQGIASTVCYPQPLHLQPVYAALGYQAGELPQSEQAAAESISLPIWPGMSEGQIDRVARCVREAVQGPG